MKCEAYQNKIERKTDHGEFKEKARSTSPAQNARGRCRWACRRLGGKPFARGPYGASPGGRMPPGRFWLRGTSSQNAKGGRGRGKSGPREPMSFRDWWHANRGQRQRRAPRHGCRGSGFAAGLKGQASNISDNHVVWLARCCCGAQGVSQEIRNFTITQLVLLAIVRAMLARRFVVTIRIVCSGVARCVFFMIELAVLGLDESWASVTTRRSMLAMFIIIKRLLFNSIRLIYDP